MASAPRRPTRAPILTRPRASPTAGPGWRAPGRGGYPGGRGPAPAGRAELGRPGPLGGREPYRPWFSSGDSLEPWFTGDPGDPG